MLNLLVSLHLDITMIENEDYILKYVSVLNERVVFFDCNVKKLLELFSV
jgi:hypothetical protein